MRTMTQREILSYECYSSWWVELIGWEWGQNLASWYLARKVERKYRRYVYAIERAERLMKL